MTDEDLARRAACDATFADLSIGDNYYDMDTASQAAIQRAKQARVVWIDPNGVIQKERRKS